MEGSIIKKNTLYLATNNKHKQEELSKLLPADKLDVKLASDLDQNIDWIEDGKTFEENAAIKASELRKYTDRAVLADDSGLEVAYLNGKPGIKSARYAGEHADDRDHVNKLLQELQGIPMTERQARFVCTLVFVNEQGIRKTYVGICKGCISTAPKGTNGFGYDSVFIPEGHQYTFAEMTSAQKNLLSHRNRAVNLWLKDYLAYFIADEL